MRILKARIYPHRTFVLAFEKEAAACSSQQGPRSSRDPAMEDPDHGNDPAMEFFFFFEKRKAAKIDTAATIHACVY